MYFLVITKALDYRLGFFQIFPTLAKNQNP